MPTGTRIKEIRKQKGLTQKQLGELCGMYESQIRKYENGNANPKIETLQKIADALDVTLLEFMDDELFDIATCDDNGESEILNRKFTKILRDNTLTKEEKTKMLYELLELNKIMAQTHKNNVEVAKKELLNFYYDMLNTEGQSQALQHMETLIKVPDFQKVTKKELCKKLNISQETLNNMIKSVSK